MDQLTRLDAEVAGRRASGALEGALRRWRMRQEAMKSFDHPEDLIRIARVPETKPQESKDLVLAGLCAEAVRGDEDAAILLVWLMLPGLLLLRRRLAARSGLDADDLDAELLAGLWEAAARVRQGASYVAKRLLDGARRRAFAAIRREENWSRRIEPLGGEVGESPGMPVDAGEVSDILSEAAAAGVISKVDVELFRASRVTMPPLRSRLGISESAARSRRLRAKRRLLDWLARSTSA